MPPRSFKSNESFIKKLSMGAIGTRFVYDNLCSQGHDPIELERGSMSYKLWREIKIKRVRVPDILCIKCGTRVESRAKRTLEISMSHSLKDQARAWDYELKDNDIVAFVRCVEVGDKPDAWKAVGPIHYVNIADMRNARKENKTIQQKPKGVEEGSEVRLVWPSVIASADGRITKITDKTIQYRKDAGNYCTSHLVKDSIKMMPLVKTGDLIHEGQVIASVVNVTTDFSCPDTKDIKYYLGQFSSPSVTDRYSAIKAIKHIDINEAKKALIERMHDERDHIYVRLEAASALLKINDKEAADFMKKMLENEYNENKLETVIILGEINNKQSIDMLVQILFDRTKHPEVRAGAAWALGELRNPETIDALIRAFDEVDDAIKIEAARALAKMAQDNTKKLLEEFKSNPDNRRPGIAWALMKKGSFNIHDMLQCMVNDDARHWTSYIIGYGDKNNYTDQIKELKEKDAEVYFAVTVLWKILSSWIDGLEEY